MACQSFPASFLVHPGNKSTSSIPTVAHRYGVCILRCDVGSGIGRMAPPSVLCNQTPPAKPKVRRCEPLKAIDASASHSRSRRPVAAQGSATSATPGHTISIFFVSLTRVAAGRRPARPLRQDAMKPGDSRERTPGCWSDSHRCPSSCARVNKCFYRRTEIFRYSPGYLHRRHGSAENRKRINFCA